VYIDTSAYIENAIKRIDLKSQKKRKKEKQSVADLF
jgi:hypothetical protein